MIERESLEKSLPRLASAAPFLCLIDDHLLCPDKTPLLDQLEKARVQARVVGELGVEGADEEAPLARGHRMALVAREHLDVGPDLLDPGRADEDAAQRRTLAGELEV